MLAALPVIQPHCLGRQRPPRLRRDDVEPPPCSRDHAAVADAAGGGQPQGETVWGPSTRGGRGRQRYAPGSTTRLKPGSSLRVAPKNFTAINRTAVHVEVVTCVPVPTPFVAKGYGERSAPVFSQVGSGEMRMIDCSTGVQQRDVMDWRCSACRSCRCSSGPERSSIQEEFNRSRLHGRHQHRIDGSHT